MGSALIPLATGKVDEDQWREPFVRQWKFSVYRMVRVWMNRG
jgi:hypothetical protein